MGMAELVRQRFAESVEVKEQTARMLALDIAAVAAETVCAFQDGKKVILCGNGGSAADAQHIAAEFVGRFMLERRALPAIALHTNTSSVTAIGNDYSYDEVFVRGVEAFGNPGDIFIGISTSGNSESIVKAACLAREKRLYTVGLTGAGGGKLAEAVEVPLCVPSDCTPRIQEAHITIGHVICELVEAELFRGAAV